MKCKYCRREIPDNSVFCNWCGKNQLEKKTKKAEPKAPKPVRLASGEYYARIMIDGQRIPVKGETLEEYEARAVALKAGVVEAKYRLPPISLGDAMKQYIAKRRAVLSPSTINGYDSMRSTRFLRYLNTNVDKIDYQRMINDEAQIVSARTLRNAWGFVKSVLRDVGRDVPTISMPQVIYEDQPFLDFEQIKVFLSAIHGKPCELAALLALHSLRRSELLALTPAKIDLDSRTIRVEGSCVRGPGNKMVTKETNKNTSSRRTVPIVIPRLEELLREVCAVTPAHERLIQTNPNSMHGAINLYCKKAGLPLVGVHGLRRSFASLAYHLGWPQLETMRMGGWSDPTIVRKVYTKLAESDVNASVESMRKFYEFTDKLPSTRKT